MDVKEEIKLQYRFNEIVGAIRDDGDDQQIGVGCVDFLEYGQPGFNIWGCEIVDKQMGWRCAQDGKKFFFRLELFTMEGSVVLEVIAEQVCFSEIILLKKYGGGHLHVFMVSTRIRVGASCAEEMNNQSLYHIKKGKKMPPFLCNYNDLEKMSRVVDRCLGGWRKTLWYQSWFLGFLFLAFGVFLGMGYEICLANTYGYDDVFFADVVKVIDGDTLEVRHQGRKLRVRLFGIDAPEWQQEFSHQAKEFTRQRVEGQRVELRSKDWDKYGRLVAVVHVSGNSLNEELLREGLAWVHIYYCKEPICRKWRQLEKEARMARRGLWKNDNPVSPWKWKQSHK